MPDRHTLAQPHDPDVRTFVRVRNVYDLPAATTVLAADLFLSSLLLRARRGAALPAAPVARG